MHTEPRQEIHQRIVRFQTQLAAGQLDGVIHHRDESGLETLIYTHPGIPAYMGMNSAGLCLLWMAIDNGERAAGKHSVQWDGRDAFGAQVTPGVYFVRLSTGGQNTHARIVAVR